MTNEKQGIREIRKTDTKPFFNRTHKGYQSKANSMEPIWTSFFSD